MSVAERLAQLQELGQSVWLDIISRDLIDSGELGRLVESGVRGLTSNPTIFEKAIAGSASYDEQISELAHQGLAASAIFDRLAVADVQAAADILRPVFEASGGADGYVSIEVSPVYADDAEQTVREVRRLRELVDRPNLLVKVPATVAGIEAIHRCLAEGMNINVTLMFSMTHYNAVAEAYISALEERLGLGEDVAASASVASFFVSRVDTLADKLIDERLAAEPDERQRPALEGLRGRLAVVNSKLVYARWKELFGSERWQRLAAQGARPQRLLWASTSTKNPAYSDVKYVDELIGPETVTTLTPETLAAFEDHGVVRLTIESDIEEARRLAAQAHEVGLDLEELGARLQVDGVAAFTASYNEVLAVIDAKVRALGEAR
jgi:transaldolase